MNILTAVVRILLGLLFIAAGASAFIITSPPALPGLAGAFNDAFVHSHWSMFVGAAQLVLGVFLTIDRFVPLALIMLAAFLYNSLAFHVTMFPSALPLVAIVIGMWFIVAWKHRARFTSILEPR